MTTEAKLAKAIQGDSRVKTFVHESLKKASLPELNLRLSSIDDYFTQFNKLQISIEQLDETELNQSTRAIIEEMYFQLKPALMVAIDNIRVRVEGTSLLQGTANQQPVSLRLPKIELKTFSGEITKWLEFFESFQSLVHKNPALDDLAKFHYLKTSLEKEAARSIESLETTPANYTEAIKILTSRYGNKKIICKDHIRKLFSFKPLDKPNGPRLRELIDTFNAHIRSLTTLGRPTKQWDDLIVHLCCSKLDSDTLEKWNNEAPSDRLETFDELLVFLNRRCQTLDNYTQSSRETTITRTQSSQLLLPRTRSTAMFALPKYKCFFCSKQGHSIFRCNRFLSLSITDRQREVGRLGLCNNCLKPNHQVKDCPITEKCRKCNLNHHTLIHPELPSTSLNEKHTQIASSTGLSSLSANATVKPSTNPRSFVVLSTAIVYVLNDKGTPIPCRALLDSGSQLHFMTEAFATQLGVKKIKLHAPIGGIGDMSVTSRNSSIITLQSRINGYSADITVHILTKITDLQPSVELKCNPLEIPQNLQLADPQFHIPQKIDMLIGAELFLELLTVGQIRLGDGFPLLQNTLLGWIISGKIVDKCAKTFCNLGTIKEPTLETVLQKFWQLETVESTDEAYTLSEQMCEENFVQTYKRDDQGRFIVKLPFKESPTSLGNSQVTATKRYCSLEKKLARNADISHQYRDFIDEYLSLGHMESFKAEDIDNDSYYLPHHCVLKPDSSTTRLRVVFDGSAKTSSGKSLNDILLVGPIVQNMLFSILIRFRSHIYVFSADISKMYRQIWVAHEDTKYQSILWRNNCSDNIHSFRLKTVTYGTSSAPFLATRCLKQLAIDEASNFPLASKAVMSDTYVDDILTGSNSKEQLMKLQYEVIKMLGTAGMSLKKWCSNDPDVLLKVLDTDREQLLHLDDSSFVKTLGMYWQPDVDMFHFHVNLQDRSKDRITKRSVISDIARIFDPLGLVSPVITVGKIFMQKLWELKQDWDASLPQELYTKWTTYRAELPKLNLLQVKRHLFAKDSPDEAELHGFADASESAYGAAIYTRSINKNGDIIVSLLCSKSRVAPLRKTTIPRLELCAAHLLAILVSRILPILNFKVNHTTYWTDSTIVLHWIKSSVSNWKPFVSNRVAGIQHLTGIDNWNHVESNLNPADIVSRGLMPREFLQSTLWFKGPAFLSSPDKYKSPAQVESCNDVPERRKYKAALIAADGSSEFLHSIKYFNNIRSLCNVIAYVNRFINNTRPVRINNERRSGPLSSNELNMSMLLIARIVQRRAFGIEIVDLQKGHPISRKSRLISLSPFLDDKNIIRVGGRLDKSNLSYTSKHPILLPPEHPYTYNLLCFYHYRYLHLGPQALLAAVREEYWPLNGRRLASKAFRHCFRCFRLRTKSRQQMMGDLPTLRTIIAPPFTSTGLDFCGPISIHYKLRGKRPGKAYIAVFVCFSTKAVHLEVASDLTTETFIGVLKRFIATRGLPQNIFSDNGTNFVGANSQLKTLNDLITSQQRDPEVIKYCQQNRITWHWQPPAAPHFGGLYEAAVKSSKLLLKRTIGDASLTFEEINTVIKQIEGILNSRPITPLSSSPDDLQPLTPGHFLIGRPLTTILEPDIQTETVSPIRRWRLVQQIQQQFWSRWTKEYLAELQHRRKWMTPTEPLFIGDLVLVKEDNLPPLKWRLARIIKLHYGDDKLSRVATIKTSNGTMVRAITKLCPLPREDEKLKEQSLQGAENVKDP